ncbi:MAG TPA: hypothetical protein QF469_02705, partial [Sphingomonas sanguinis]|nr:hypothetical protein [Sphingomonas sanguinis]
HAGVIRRQGVTTMLLSLLLTSALAATSPVRDAPPTTVTLDTVAVVTRSGAAPAATPTRYCIVEALTGTRIRTKVCHTADEWIASEGEVPTGRITRR